MTLTVALTTGQHYRAACDNSQKIVVLSPSRRDSRRDLASSLSHIEFRIDCRKMEIVSLYSHLGHIISSSDSDSLDIMKQKRAFNGQVNNMLCFFGKLLSVVKSRLFASYCTSFYGYELRDLTCVQLYV